MLNGIKQILMERDGVDEGTAKELIQEAKDDLLAVGATEEAYNNGADTMTKLTLKTALYHMARMWARLAKTGQDYKPYLPGIKNDCYLCAFFYNNNGCKRCQNIMKEIWANGCRCEITSVYEKWDDCCGKLDTKQLRENRMKYARQIANEAWVQWRLIK